MGSHDLDNIENREARKTRHNDRADQERADFIKKYEEHVTIISWQPLNKELPHDEFLVRFKLTNPQKPDDFLHKLVKAFGEIINV